MSKKYFSSLALLVTLAFAMSSFASDFYISGQVGGSLPLGKLSSSDISSPEVKKSLNKNVVYDIVVGNNINSNLAVELELAYTKHKFTRSFKDIESLSDYLPVYENGEETGEYKEIVENIDKDYNVKSSVSSISSFINTSYKFELSNLPIKVKPYITAGVGFSSNKTGKISYIEPSQEDNFYGKSKTKNNFVWQVGIGVLIPVKDNININLSFKYRDLGKIKSANYLSTNTFSTDDLKLKGRLRTFNLMAGITFDI
jgi:opacity protein-like surface antigen